MTVMGGGGGDLAIAPMDSERWVGGERKPASERIHGYGLREGSAFSLWCVLFLKVDFFSTLLLFCR